MSSHKYIDRICASILALTLVIAVLFCNGDKFGIKTAAHTAGYEARLFDNSKVHTIEIVMNDWDSFIETCESEEYSPCNLVIDGEAVKNVGIRGKGNTSLSSVKNMNSSRYSFKIEFDQYEKGKSYHGLDKLCLNNIIQDNTYMKDYLAYTLMNDFGADSPLCSYAYITVNGEDWGLYLAVEAIEESFLERNYSDADGELYKPDSMSFGGGRGNGRDLSMSEFMDENSDKENDGSAAEENENKGEDKSGGFSMPEGFDPNIMPDMGSFDPSQMGGDMPDMSGFDPSQMFGGGNGGGGFGGFGGMGSSDVKLQYIDDDEDSYSNIFNNAKTAVDTADKKRLIRSLKTLSEGSDIGSVVDIEEVLRYFVVHDFLVNGDSYTGQMVHNYYLYEEDGQLSMIPWDYNLAYGSFMGGDATGTVNTPIDTPVSNGMSDRPMIAWIFDSEEYTEQYHELFSEFIGSYDFEKLVSDTADMIREYVEKDPTKFCTYEEFEKGVEAISKYCTLRAESVKGQLNGTIPSTSEGQKADSSSLIDASSLNISDMGSMGGNGGFGGGNMPDMGNFGGRSFGGSDNSTDSGNDTAPEDPESKTASAEVTGTKAGSTSAKVVSLNSKQGMQPPSGGGMPDMGDFDPNNMPDMGDFDPGNMPDMGDFDPDNMPEGFDPGNMPGGFGGNAPAVSDSGEETSSETESAADSGTDDSAGASDRTVTRPERPSDNGNSGENSGRPQMSGMPSAGGMQGSDTTAYILMGVSAAVLLFGVIFALKFKR